MRMKGGFKVIEKGGECFTLPRGVRGHAPLENFYIFGCTTSNLVLFHIIFSHKRSDNKIHKFMHMSIAS